MGKIIRCDRCKKELPFEKNDDRILRVTADFHYDDSSIIATQWLATNYLCIDCREEFKTQYNEFMNPPEEAPC